MGEEVEEYDWAKDNAAIEADHVAELHDKDMPWVLYQDGLYRACFDTFERAMSHAAALEWLGRCTIRDAFAPPFTIGPLFDAGFSAGRSSRDAEIESLRATLARETKP